jgi:hypothetical protein
MKLPVVRLAVAFVYMVYSPKKCVIIANFKDIIEQMSQTLSLPDVPHVNLCVMLFMLFEVLK